MTENNNENDEITEFSYFLSDKKPILVVTFVGPMRLQSVPDLMKCCEEIKALDGIKFVILYFRDVSVIAGEAITILTQIQVAIRAKHCHLVLCSLKPFIREKLMNMGTIRQSEIKDNLQSAIQSFLMIKKI